MYKNCNNILTILFYMEENDSILQMIGCRSTSGSTIELLIRKTFLVP